MAKKVAIVCEGKTDIYFLMNFIEYLGYRKNDVSTYTMSGKSNFFDTNYKKYNDLKLELKGNGIKKILFVVDADDTNKDQLYGGYKNTEEQLNQVINQLGIANISQIYIMCDPKTTDGNLESLMLSTIDSELRACIEGFLACSQIQSKENHKAIINQIFNIAYPDKPYNFEHKYFKPLKAQLENLFT